MTTVNYGLFRRFKYRDIIEIRKISEMLNWPFIQKNTLTGCFTVFSGVSPCQGVSTFFYGENTK